MIFLQNGRIILRTDEMLFSDQCKWDVSLTGSLQKSDLWKVVNSFEVYVDHISFESSAFSLLDLSLKPKEIFQGARLLMSFSLLMTNRFI